MSAKKQQNWDVRELNLDLAAACAAGDRSAQRQVTERVFDLVTATVSYALNSRFFADDTVQDSLLEILHSMDHYRGDCSIETWARKITVRVVYKRIRKQRRREGLMGFYPKSEPEWPRAEDNVSNRQLRLFLNELIARLPEKQAVVIRLRFVHEHSIKEIAQIVDAPQETVRVRLKRGKAKLQTMIQHHPAFCSWLDKESV